MAVGNSMSVFRTPALGAVELDALERIEAIQTRLRYLTAEPRRWLRPIRRVLAARAIQGSNSIEGFQVSDRDAVAAVDGDRPQLDDASFRAVSSYQRAMTYVLQLARRNESEVSAPLIKALHFMIAEDDLDAHPGVWRPGGVFVHSSETNDTVYTGPDVELVPGLIEALVDSINEADSAVAPMVKAAMAHLNLAMIHPFKDGNGRMARCLQTLVLATSDVRAVQEFISIEEYLGRPRNTLAYYDILAEVGQGSWNPQNDALPWVRFCLQAHYSQSLSVLDRVQLAEWLWGEIEALVAETGVPARSVQPLMDPALGVHLTNSSYRAAIDGEVSPQVASRDLKQLVDAGLIEQRGAKRGAHYVAADRLGQLRSRYRARVGAVEDSTLSWD